MRKQEYRLGYNGMYEVKTHTWFKDFDWDRLMKKQLTPPFVPPVQHS